MPDVLKAYEGDSNPVRLPDAEPPAAAQPAADRTVFHPDSESDGLPFRVDLFHWSAETELGHG